MDANKNTNILVVDDQKDFSSLIMIWLKSKGYSTSTAPDGQKAIDMIKESVPDIVFLDLNMPGMDGIETVRQIRSFNKTLPIIIISAHLDKMKLSDVEQHGISGVFYKGEDFDRWLTLLETVLRTHGKLKK